MRKLLLIAISTLVLVGGTKAQIWWPQNSTISTNLRNINFYDDYYGFSFGDTLSSIVKTNVSGVVWNQLNPSFTDGDLRSSVFISVEKIIAVGITDVDGKGLVLQSTDWGGTWLKHGDTFDAKLYDIDYSGADVWICGSNGAVYKSTDDGATWFIQASVTTTENLYSIDFVTANDGWYVGGVDTSAVITHTNDGGLFWQRQSSGITDTLYSVFFINNVKGWAVGANGTILSTVNAGNSWNQEVSGTANHLYDVWFINDNIGWAVGAGGTVLKTTNGGNNWNPENSGTLADIHSIMMKSDTLGWICGDSGVIKVYGNNPPSAIKEVKDREQITIHPNPTDGFATITNGEQGITNVEVYDVFGRPVPFKFDIGRSLLDIRSSPPGIYFVRLVLSGVEGVEAVRKLIKH